MRMRSVRVQLTLTLAVLAALSSSSAPGRVATKSTEKIYGETREKKALVYFVREPNRWSSALTTYLYARPSLQLV